ncbi:MAG: hypothetical protein Q4D95_05145 [Peptoniphilus sp.]|nr:hypothetical protein [Peptoniphilus sp.]
MVTFVIEKKDSTKAVYRYYPEDNRDSAFGIISICLENKEASIDKVAEEDSLYRTSADE